MPRPDYSARRAGGYATPTASNPISKWLQRRKERRSQFEEEASRLITNRAAENEQKIIDQLKAVDFPKSRLPKAVLEQKSIPTRRYGDLEYTQQAIIHKLQTDPQTIKVNVQEIDTRLMTLVLLFKDAIEKGDAQAAMAAKSGLARGFEEIRSRVPQDQSKLARRFVEVGAHHLDQWILLVQVAQEADQIKRKIDDLQKKMDNHIASMEQEAEKARKRISTDDDYAQAYDHICKNNAPEARSKWTALQREVHKNLIDIQFQGVLSELDGLMLQQNETMLVTKSTQVETLYSGVMNMEVVSDPDLMSKFNESVDEMFKQIARTDAEIDETMKIMTDIQGRVDEMNYAPGAQRSNEIALQGAVLLKKMIHEQQDKLTGKNVSRTEQIRKEHGIFNDEELTEQRKQNEEQAQQLAEVEEEVAEQQSEGEYLAN